ncbi:hypothetical protein ACQ4M4_03675 [Leptolyngbya sp. AN02str]|uniref:hypothetical protein n=1 Tax=Leptolyngbya sp. AN02str TaxID=3423363 RepID=UPI003D31C6FC
MTTINSYPNAPDLSANDYVVMGLATCFLREDGETHPIKVVEPIPAATLETLKLGIPTSYEMAIATTLGAVLSDGMAHIPAEFPPETQICDEFELRTYSAARTYRAKPATQDVLPLGTSRSDFNHSTERKRILNSDRMVKTEDNVKQHAYTHQVL